MHLHREPSPHHLHNASTPTESASQPHAEQPHGAEAVHWDLSDLYASPTDPKLEADKASLLDEAQAMATHYRGNIASLDADAMLGLLDRYEALLQTAHRLGSYAHLI
jgi:oligoendopeptidase F